MATGAPDIQRDNYIHHIKIEAFPDLGSNFQFLNYTEISNSVAEDSYERLNELGYAVELNQQMVEAGGTGLLPGLFDILQQIWDNKALLTIPLTIIKYSFAALKGRSAKPQQSRRHAKITVYLQAYSATLRSETGVFTEKEPTLSALLEAATVIAPMLQEKYPHIGFLFQLELKLDEHHAQQTYALRARELGYKRVPALFKSIALNEDTMSYIAVTKRYFFKRIDSVVDSKYSQGSIWSYSAEQKPKTYYYLLVGRLVRRDYKRLNRN